MHYRYVFVKHTIFGTVYQPGRKSCMLHATVHYLYIQRILLPYAFSLMCLRNRFSRVVFKHFHNNSYNHIYMNRKLSAIFRIKSPCLMTSMWNKLYNIVLHSHGINQQLYLEDTHPYVHYEYTSVFIVIQTNPPRKSLSHENDHCLVHITKYAISIQFYEIIKTIINVVHIFDGILVGAYIFRPLDLVVLQAM